MDRDLAWKLFTPLTVLAIGSGALHLILEWEGFWMNLATEVLGIVVTIGYVDYIIRRSNTAKQAVADALVNRRLQRFVNSSLRECREALGHDIRMLKYWAEQGYYNQDRFREEQAITVHERMIPGALERIRSLDQLGWKRLSGNLKNISESAERLLLVHGQRFQPAILASVIEVQGTADAANFAYEVFPHVLGVPPEKVPPNRYGDPPEERQDVLCDMTAKEVRKLLQLLISLSQPWEESTPLYDRPPAQNRAAGGVSL